MIIARTAQTSTGQVDKFLAMSKKLSTWPVDVVKMKSQLYFHSTQFAAKSFQNEVPRWILCEFNK